MSDPSEEIPKENECLQCGALCEKDFCSKTCFNYYNE